MGTITDMQLIAAKLASGSMDIVTKMLKDLIDDHANVVKVVTTMRKLFEGDHEILQKKDEGSRPNNKLVFNFPKLIILFAVDYLFGNLHSYKVSLPEDHLDYTKAKTFKELVEQIHAANDEDMLLRDIYKYLLIDGRSWELLYIDQNGDVCSMICPESEVIPVFDGSKQNSLVYCIRYWKEEVMESDDIVKERIRVEFYDQEMVTNYVQSDDKFVLDPEKPPYPHFFEEVPLIQYKNAIDESDLDDVKSLVNEYEQKRSGRSNDLEYAADSYLWIHNVLFGVDEDGKELSEDEKRQRMIQALKSRWLETRDALIEGEEETVVLKAVIQYITKELPVEPLKDQLEDVRKSIYTLTMTPAIFDTGANFSNVAEATLRLLFLPADMKADNNEPKLKSGLRKRFRLIAHYLYLKTGVQYDPTWIEVEFFRNRIINRSELITDIVNAKRGGILDRKSAVSKNPLVDDPEATLKELDKEAEEEAKRLNTDWGLADHEEDDIE